MNNQLLLIEDVNDLGRSGDVVRVKPGFARNFLIPQKKAVFATKGTLRMQERLKEERAKKAVIDKKEAEDLAARIEGMVLTTTVKVDPEGHMYGSVTVFDVLDLLKKEGIELEKRNMIFPTPIKELGVKEINLKLNEGVPSKFTLKILAEGKPEVVESLESPPSA
ncbi:MAG TPA: 50S ribosomal protein L9 [Rhabdochlamydiaceae bacterium]|nr:50S ribosomal protein L9 [Rhabdochlamydiaceae bacterium]